MTAGSPVILIAFIGLLLFVLVSMSIYRSPAVALMPDVTIKPLRSKANAVINLMGAIGGAIVIILGMAYKADAPFGYISYTLFFGTVSALMLLFLALFLFKVKEPRLSEEYRRNMIKYNIDGEECEDGSGEKLPKDKLRSLLFILASVFLWFMAYNAVTSKFSVYAGNVLGMGFFLPLLLAQVSAIVAFIPIGIIASKFGRKKTILVGVTMLTAAFFLAYFIGRDVPQFLMYLIFVLAGLAWTTINVNSYPMVVELAKGGNVGRYTGFYYTASMAAQILTPILSGALMDLTSMRALFPYAAVFAALAFVTMLFVKHGDNKPPAKKGIEAYDAE
jgi:MFS family permease